MATTPPPTTTNSSEPSFLAKFFYQNICTRCAPESIRITQAINQQIATDLLYTYDPFQPEVGKRKQVAVFID
jgi:hypothetical protein